MTFNSPEDFACRIDRRPWVFDTVWLVSFCLFVGLATLLPGI